MAGHQCGASRSTAGRGALVLAVQSAPPRRMKYAVPLSLERPLLALRFIRHLPKTNDVTSQLARSEAAWRFSKRMVGAASADPGSSRPGASAGRNSGMARG
jgi:hypothetical protein